MAKMSDSTLRAMLASEHADALAATNASKLSAARSDAMSYYNGDMSKDMPVSEGRSSAVSMDVCDAVEGMMPQLMDIFVGSDEVVRFEPSNAEDVEPAKQETDYINHVFMNQNPGFLVLYSFIKDALLQKVGVVKVWWEEREQEQRETYLDQTADAYALIMASDDVEVVEHTAHPDERAPQPIEGQPPQEPAILHDVTVVTKKTHAQAKVLGVPPEEFGIEKDARSIKDCNYCYHKVLKTESQLIEQGYDKKQIKTLPSYRASTNTEETTRDTVDENLTGAGDELNAASRQIEVIEHYTRMNYDGSGKASLYRVTTGGSQGDILKKDGKLDIEPFDAIPFAAITPIIVTHRFFGRSLADLVMDIQRIKTALLRGLLDNTYMVTNPRVVVAETLASDNTLDDLLVSRPNGIVRAKTTDAIQWQTVPSVGAAVYPALEYLDSTREMRTGVTKMGQGLDPDVLQNQSATAAALGHSAAQMKTKLVARIFAETGIRDLFWLLHATVRKHSTEGDQTIMLGGKNPLTVNPRNWKQRDNLNVNVGLGNGGRQEQAAFAMQIMNIQKEIAMNGLTNVVGPEQIYNSALEFTKAVGHKDGAQFFTDPKTQPPLQPKPDPEMMKLQAQSQLAQQADQRKAQLDQQTMQQKSQIESVQAQADIATQRDKTQAEMAQTERKAQLEERLMVMAHELKARTIEAELQMKRELHQHTIAQSQIGMVASAQSHSAKMQQMAAKPQPAGAE